MFRKNRSFGTQDISSSSRSDAAAAAAAAGQPHQGLDALGLLLDGAVAAAAVRVLVQQAHPGEGLAALAARVLLVLQVRLQVRAQVALVGEGARAVVAGEGLLPGVRAHVALQQPGPGEALAADVALAGQRVRADVHLQGGEGGVALATVLAGEAAGDLVAAVQLAVLGVAGLRGEGLLALGAAEGL